MTHSELKRVFYGFFIGETHYGDPFPEKWIENQFNHLIKSKCFLCDFGDIEVLGRFTPGKTNEQKLKFGVKKDMNKMFIYVACLACAKKPAFLKDIEGIIQHAVGKREIL